MNELLYILGLSLLNCLGGRGKDVGVRHWGKFFFRFLLPVAATFAYCHYSGFDTYRVFIILLGTALAYGLWFPWGWSFDEIDSRYDPNKYHRFVRLIGLKLYPLDNLKSTNRKRGIVMKCLRGMYGYPGFIMLAWYFNPLALLYGFAWGTQGIVYWLVGRQVSGRRMCWSLKSSTAR